ncbi:putative mucin TcMUCII [Trypanosoma cruzi]|uniref:Mucin TcMUCII, putative n=2 Tax=Trypanosoma cruzi TaxID=5693 RepID=Q4DNH0_TRYCC|nr:mucin TcMUCII, putative [Trypanosoma cruzi]EAN94062.1 mucin TcMUCII, putative [Trypanosoma cruzi]PWV15827.1 putative mucin TcMUCII [Trypanosoma cruzi]|eukprot:XP_815913.1 mucin TcMUCII [Trypanosoma cruzi strain CL Brener]
MMTCRLLCALLVLALCCCSSVCASAEPEPKVDGQASQTTTPTITQPQVTDDKAIIQAVGEATGESPLLLEGAQGEGQSGPPATSVTNPSAMPGGNGGSGPGATGSLQAADNDGTTGPQGSKGKPADQANENAEGGVDTTTTTITTHAADDEDKATPDAEANKKVTSSLLPAPENSRPEAAEESATEPAPGNILPEAPRLTVPRPKVNPEYNTVQKTGTNGTAGQESGTSTSTEQANKETEDAVPTKTTKTKTKATTTTTTTTTEAPSTTTTEAPAVSTTRAPSRLREIDGSLSSSARVCAPLVLAASALAYTTVG